MRLEGHFTVTEHDTTSSDIADRVHVRVDLELANTLIRWLHCILGLVGGILFEFGGEAHTRVRDGQILEHDVVILFQLHADDGALVADEIHLLLDVSFLDNYARLLDCFGAREHTLYQVDSCERLDLP